MMGRGCPQAPCWLLTPLGEAGQAQDVLFAPAIATSLLAPPAALATCPTGLFSAPRALVLGANSGSGCFLGPLGSRCSRTKLHQQRPATAGNYWVITRLLRVCLRSCNPSAIQCCSGSLSLLTSFRSYPEPIAHARAGVVLSMADGHARALRASDFWDRSVLTLCHTSNCPSFAHLPLPSCMVSWPAPQVHRRPRWHSEHHVRQGAGG